MAFRLYVDEVGNGDLDGAADDPNVRYLSLTGIWTLLRLHDSDLQPRLDSIKTDLFGHTPESPVILHRRDVMRREGPFADLRKPEVDAAFRERLLAILASFAYIAVTVTIDKKEHLDRYQAWRFDPYHYCLQCIIERYVKWLDRHGLKGDVMVEARMEKVDKKLKASFTRIWNNGTDYLLPLTAQHCLTSSQLKLSTKKGNHAGLQLCDTIAYPSFKAMKRQRIGEPRLEDFGYQIYDLLVSDKYARKPGTNQIVGWGQKWLP